MKTSLIWKRLLIVGKKIVGSSEIKSLARELGKNEERSLYYLQEEGYIVRIFRGIFYVKTMEERELGTFNNTIYEIVALALKEKGVENWYFGLENGLKINNMTHEYFTIDYVITDSYRTTKVIRICNTRFQFFKRSIKQFQNGILQRDGVRYSNPEKTVLDLVYQRYLDSGDSDYLLLPIKEYREKIDLRMTKDYLSMYPPSFQAKVEEFL